jgi:hypothetical protein
VRPEYAGRAGGTIAGVKKVLAVVFAVAAVVVAIVWWRGRGGEPPRPAPSATVGSAGATLAGPGAPAPAAPLTGRVEGTVVGADGQPVPGATVAVVDRGPPRAVEPDGRFVVHRPRGWHLRRGRRAAPGSPAGARRRRRGSRPGRRPGSR